MTVFLFCPTEETPHMPFLMQFAYISPHEQNVDCRAEGPLPASWQMPSSLIEFSICEKKQNSCHNDKKRESERDSSSKFHWRGRRAVSGCVLSHCPSSYILCAEYKLLPSLSWLSSQATANPPVWSWVCASSLKVLMSILVLLPLCPLQLSHPVSVQTHCLL